MMNKLINIPKFISDLPENMRVYRLKNWKEHQRNFDSEFMLLMPVDTSKTTCEDYANGMKVGDIFEMLPESGYPKNIGKKLVFVGIGLAEYFKMFFYVEGEEGISYFEEDNRQLLKNLKKVGHIKLP